MNRPVPRKYRLDTHERKPERKVGIWWGYIRGLRIPGLLLVAGILTFVFAYIFGNDAQAKPVINLEGRSYTPVCRWCGKVERNESLYLAITGAGLSPRVVYDIDRGLDGVFDTRKVMPGDLFTLDLDNSGRLLSFELERSPWEKYRVVRDGDTVRGIVDTIPLTYVLRSAKGKVHSTLWESMANLGIPAEAILKFTDILSFNVDFLTETRDGQEFAIMYEEFYFDGEPIEVGRVMAAHYWMADTNYAGIYYMDPDSVAGYYTLDGKNTKKALLRTPLVYRRISSHFSHSRFHPILKVRRPHLGVDYAAPTGTPVSASGSGRVVYAGWKGGFGNFIEISHPGNIRTMYGHLSRFARGIKKGTKVKQGQLIGHVGSTGLSTGPHLDYRVKVGGKFVNPLRYAFPDGPPVKKKYAGEFTATASDYLGLLDVLTSPIITGL